MNKTAVQQRIEFVLRAGMCQEQGCWSSGYDTRLDELTDGTFILSAWPKREMEEGTESDYFDPANFDLFKLLRAVGGNELKRFHFSQAHETMEIAWVEVVWHKLLVLSIHFAPEDSGPLSLEEEGVLIEALVGGSGEPAKDAEPEELASDDSWLNKPIADEVLCDLLALAGKCVSSDPVQFWSKDQREAAARWSWSFAVCKGLPAGFKQAVSVPLQPPCVRKLPTS